MTLACVIKSPSSFLAALRSSGRVLGLTLLAALLLAPPIVAEFSQASPPEDYLSFHFAAVAARGNPMPDPWDPAALRRVATASGFSGRVYPYLYPPLLAVVLAPLSSMPLAMAKNVWIAASLMAACLACGLLGAAIEGGRRRVEMTLVSAMLLLLAGWVANVGAGQSNVFIVLCLVVTMVAVLRERVWMAGVALSVAAMIKVTPGLLLLHFIIRRQWSAVVAFALSSVLLIGATFLGGRGTELWSSYLDALPRLGHGQTIEGLFPPGVLFNVSVAGAVARWTEDPTSIRIWTLLAMALVVGLTLSRSYRARSAAGSLAPLAALTSILVLGSPFGYWHHALMLAPAVAFVWAFKDRSSPWVLPCTVILLALCALNLPAAYHRVGLVNPPPMIASLGTWLHLALWLGLLARRG